jgi:hypothetical protein
MQVNDTFDSSASCLIQLMSMIHGLASFQVKSKGSKMHLILTTMIQQSVPKSEVVSRLNSNSWPESSNIHYSCEPMNYGKQQEGELSEPVSIPKTTPTYFYSTQKSARALFRSSQTPEAEPSASRGLTPLHSLHNFIRISVLHTSAMSLSCISIYGYARERLGNGLRA